MTNNFKQETKTNLSCRSFVNSVCHSGLDPESRHSNHWILNQVQDDPSTTLGAGNRKSFTLIELLVVLALVAILSVVVVMTLNPAELLKQARDSNRLSDLATINTALNLFSADVTSGFMGTSTVVYVSIPDNASSTCGSLGLPSLPTGYTYNCVTNQNLRNTDGTGWIPVNFNRISSNSPISQLPIDPQNTTSTKYYTYVTGGSWQLAVKMESQKYIAQSVSSNDYDPGLYTTGNSANLAPFVGGLVGIWKFDEGNGTSSADGSGYGKNAGMLAAQTPANLFTSTGCKSGSCASFATASSSINIPNNLAWNFGSGSFTLSFWANVPAATYGNIAEHSFTDAQSGLWTLRKNSAGEKPNFYMYDDNRQQNACTFTGLSFGSLQYLTVVVNKSSAGSLICYINGLQVGIDSSLPVTGNYAPNTGFYLGGLYENQSGFIQNLLVDDLRIYSRALSAAEISALYNATK